MRVSFIVQAESLEKAVAAIESVGATVTHELGIVDAVAARLDADQLDRLARQGGELRIRRDSEVEVAGDPLPYSHYPALIGADTLHAQGITGYGVTVAVVDTGYYSAVELEENTQEDERVLAHYDAIADSTLETEDSSDDNGHGSHVTGIAVSAVDGQPEGKSNGVAPDADLVVVKAFGEDGTGTYADVIRGLDWILVHHNAYGIRVVNLSFSAPAISFYWEDPLNQAVMELWNAGITVVASAGNGGPDPMTIGVPGNLPYVITVGAMTDHYTPADGSDDRLASFSASGPTLDAFVKPEVVAPGGHMLSVMWSSAWIASQFPQFQVDDRHFTMSGTSQAAAVASGVVALMLEADPTLLPDDVKCRLMSTAKAAVDGNGDPAQSVFRQGNGLVDAVAAVASTQSGCANVGLDLANDISGTEHYMGPVRWNSISASFYLPNVGHDWDGTSASGGTPWIDTDPWSAADPWAGSSPWVDSDPWIDLSSWHSANPWVDSDPWIDLSSLSATASVNVWVVQE